MESWMIELAISAVLGLIGWLLSSKDKAQQDQIDALKSEVALLFKKHDTDVAQLQALEVKVAESYHKKPEIEERFKRLEDVVLNGFRELRADLKNLIERWRE